MSESILTSTKASLGLPEGHTAFDSEILMHINSVLATLNQLGVGPVNGLYIEDVSTEWSAMIGDNPKLNPVKTYTHLRVKMLFDPPDIGFVITAIKAQIEELEWRLMVEVDPYLPVVVVADSDVIMDGGEI